MLTPYHQLPEIVLDSMNQGDYLARQHVAAKGGNPLFVADSSRRAWTTLVGLSTIKGLNVSFDDLAELAKLPTAPNIAKDGKYLHQKFARALSIGDAYARATAKQREQIAKDAVVSSVGATQIVKGAEELKQSLPWRALAPPTVKPEWGRSSMEVYLPGSFGASGVHGNMAGPFEQIKVNQTVSNAKIGYVINEVSADPLMIAQASMGGMNLEAFSGMAADLAQELQIGKIVMFGDSAYDWSSAFGTITDSTSVKVDGTVALLVTGIRAVVTAYRTGLGSVAEAFDANFCVVSLAISEALGGPLAAEDSSRSGWDYLKALYPNITWTVSAALDNHPAHSGNSLISVGYHGPSQGPNAVIWGPQALCDDADTLFSYQDGLRRKTLRLRSIAGTHNPYSELVVTHRFDTVT